MHGLAPFRFDVFISYGWAGIQRKEDADRGWVDEFKRRLAGQLSGELGREARIYLDVEQSQNGELPANLTDAVRSSVLFLAVVSPGSVRADSWCHFELARFMEHAAGLLKDLKQVFVTRVRSVAPAQWPEPIRKIISYDFLGDDPRHKTLPVQASPSINDFTTPPDVWSSRPSGHRREVLNANPERLIEHESCCGPRPPSEGP